MREAVVGLLVHRYNRASQLPSPASLDPRYDPTHFPMDSPVIRSQERHSASLNISSRLLEALLSVSSGISTI